MGRLATLMGIGTLLMSSCALFSGSLESVETSTVYELRSIDAACLLAEHLAMQFPSIDPDPLHPKARAYDRGSGYYRILYQRIEGRSFLPEANGRIGRDQFFCSTEQLFGDPTPDLLRDVRFVEGPSTSVPAGCLERITVWIDPIEPSRCRVVVELLGGTVTSRQKYAEAIERLLSFSQRLATAHRLLASDQREKALGALDETTQDYLRGFSSAHNPLLAQAFVLMSRIHLGTGDPVAAEQAMHQARLVAPASAELAERHTLLLGLRAKPHAIPDILRFAARMTPPGSQREQELILSRIVAQRDAERFTSVQQTLEHARALAKAEDWTGLRAWANRALDLQPGNPEAWSLLADAFRRTGRTRDSRDTRLLALLSGLVSANQILELSETELELGDPDLALRWILRFSGDFPELLDDPHTDRLAKSLGWERTLRAMTVEHLEPETLRLLVAWMKTETSVRKRFIGGVLLAALESRIAISTQRPEIAPDAVGAGSGVQSSTPSRPDR